MSLNFDRAWVYHSKEELGGEQAQEGQRKQPFSF